MLTLTQPVVKIALDRKPVSPPKKKFAERGYLNSLKLVADEIEKMLKVKLTSVTPSNGVKAINLLKDYSNSIVDWATKTVSTMLYNVNKDNQKVWEKHSAKMSAELRAELSKAPAKAWMQKYMDDNIGLIKSMPLEAAKKVHKLIKENQTKGLRSSELVDEIMRIGDIQRNRAELIARTETSRYSTALTEMRASSIGSDWYVWKSTGDFRTRKGHKRMDGVVINWNDPPSPEKLVGEKAYGEYHAGETFNCRCYPEPILDVDDITFPAKVYRSGRIQTMKKDEFTRLVTRH